MEEVREIAPKQSKLSDHLSEKNKTFAHSCCMIYQRPLCVELIFQNLVFPTKNKVLNARDFLDQYEKRLASKLSNKGGCLSVNISS
jgi:hypothetical protein